MLHDVVEQCETLRAHSKPVELAWQMGCDLIGLSHTDPWRDFGIMFAQHPDLQHSTLAYHNHFHSAEAVVSAAHLAAREFGENSVYSPILMFAMLCHDIAHTGKTNSYDYELETQALNAMREFISPDMQQFWNEHLQSTHGTMKNLLNTVEPIVLGTDFKNGPKLNQSNYRLNAQNNPLHQLCMLANEADILPSIILETGVPRGHWVAQEANNPAVGSWKGRMFFLSQLAVCESQASKDMGVHEHIEAQIAAIGALDADFLEMNNVTHGWENSVQLVQQHMNFPAKRMKV